MRKLVNVFLISGKVIVITQRAMYSGPDFGHTTLSQKKIKYQVMQLSV